MKQAGRGCCAWLCARKVLVYHWALRCLMQDFFEIFDLDAIRKLALRLPHLSDGIIFTPVKLPYVTGTSPLLLKWKPPHLNTVRHV